MKNCTRQSKTAGLQFLGYVTSDILLLLMFKQINFLYLYLYLTLVTVKLCINYFRTIKSIQNIHHHRGNEVLSLISVTKKKKEKQNAIATAHAANDTALVGRLSHIVVSTPANDLSIYFMLHTNKSRY